MTSLHTRISKSPELKAGWHVISHELTEYLKDLATSIEYTTEKTDAEVGQSTRIIADLRHRIEKTTDEDSPLQKKRKMHRVSPLPQPER